MNILLVGKGAREHTIAYKLSQSEKLKKLYIAPSNCGMESLGMSVNIREDDIHGLVNFAKENNIDLVVVGPELPLCMGIYDEMKKNGIKVFGASKEAAKLEGSKIYAKEFMEKYNIPTAKYKKFDDANLAIDYLPSFTLPVVIKADGLAAGKGVIIAYTYDDAKIAIKDMLENKKFGDSGNSLILEEYLDGVEASQFCFVDGESIVALDTVQDYKREKDGDVGENTGGMGTYSPSKFMSENTKKYVLEKIMLPFIDGLKKESLEYKGLIFIGLMIKDEKAKVVEFNVRFGDPETQSLLMRMDTDLLELMYKTAKTELSDVDIKWSNKHSVCVVLASEGYPRKFVIDREISGLDRLEDVEVFHAATKDINGKIYTNGGRVLSIVAMGDTLEMARNKAYKEAEKVHFDGMHYRKDIANVD